MQIRPADKGKECTLEAVFKFVHAIPDASSRLGFPFCFVDTHQSAKLVTDFQYPTYMRKKSKQTDSM